jgi:hypothetical protein
MSKENENLNEAQTGNSVKADVSKRFSVHTYSIINEDSPMYAHWSEGLKMIIVKDGVTLKLNSEEIEQLVKALPRTVGGSY